MSDEKTFSQEYVTELREEAKKNRIKAEGFETSLKELKDKFERAKREAAETGAAEDGKYKELYEAAKETILGHETTIEEMEAKIGENESLTSTLEGYLESEIEEIPEEKRGSIPNLSTTEKLAWLKQAKKDGLFGDGKKGASEHRGVGEDDDTEKNPWTKEHWNLTEQGKLLQKDKALASKLMAIAGK